MREEWDQLFKDGLPGDARENRFQDGTEFSGIQEGFKIPDHGDAIDHEDEIFSPAKDGIIRDKGWFGFLGH